MSATANYTDETLENILRLEEYLESRVASEGRVHFKSKFITDEVQMSAKQIGQFLAEVDNRENDIAVERWGRGSSPTWVATPV